MVSFPNRCDFFARKKVHTVIVQKDFLVTRDVSVKKAWNDEK
jgi:hypothetical protein